MSERKDNTSLAKKLIQASNDCSGTFVPGLFLFHEVRIKPFDENLNQSLFQTKVNLFPSILYFSAQSPGYEKY
jgi:hypothetical protein